MSQEWTRIEHTGSLFEFKKLQKISKVETYKLSIQIIIFKGECMIAVGYPSNCIVYENDHKVSLKSPQKKPSNECLQSPLFVC